MNRHQKRARAHGRHVDYNQAVKQAVTRTVKTTEEADELIRGWLRPGSIPSGPRIILHPCPGCGKSSSTSLIRGMVKQHCQHCRPEEEGLRFDTLADFMGHEDDTVTEDERLHGIIPGKVLPNGKLVTRYRGTSGERMFAEACPSCGTMARLQIERDGATYCEECIAMAP